MPIRRLPTTHGPRRLVGRRSSLPAYPLYEASKKAARIESRNPEFDDLRDALVEAIDKADKVIFYRPLTPKISDKTRKVPLAKANFYVPAPAKKGKPTHKPLNINKALVKLSQLFPFGRLRLDKTNGTVVIPEDLEPMSKKEVEAALASMNLPESEFDLRKAARPRKAQFVADRDLPPLRLIRALSQVLYGKTTAIKARIMPEVSQSMRKEKTVYTDWQKRRRGLLRDRLVEDVAVEDIVDTSVADLEGVDSQEELSLPSSTLVYRDEPIDPDLLEEFDDEEVEELDEIDEEVPFEFQPPRVKKQQRRQQKRVQVVDEDEEDDLLSVDDVTRQAYINARLTENNKATARKLADVSATKADGWESDISAIREAYYTLREEGKKSEEAATTLENQFDFEMEVDTARQLEERFRQKTKPRQQKRQQKRQQDRQQGRQRRVVVIDDEEALKQKRGTLKGKLGALFNHLKKASNEKYLRYTPAELVASDTKAADYVIEWLEDYMPIDQINDDKQIALMLSPQDLHDLLGELREYSESKIGRDTLELEIWKDVPNTTMAKEVSAWNKHLDKAER